ncbi:hypothetical protein PybrP1_009514 [[Pythium] brassicae (nom. inval.)]|nr:hypothetical protein PybrP1_009514 [[Pythium] brassicae (nom. inval.)]
MVSVLRALLVLAAAAATVAAQTGSGSSSGGETLAPSTPAPATRAPSPTSRAPSATTVAPTTAPPSDGSHSSGSTAGESPAPTSAKPTPKPKANSTDTSKAPEEPVATVKTRASVVRALTPPPTTDDVDTTGNAALDSDSVKSEYGTKAPAAGEAEVSSSSAAGSAGGGWMVPVIIGAVVVSALVVVTVYVRHKRSDNDDDDDDNVDDFQRRTNNFFQHPRTTNNQQGAATAAPLDPEPPLFKPRPEPSSVALHAVSVQPATRSPRKFSIPMLQSPQRVSGESIDGRDTVSAAQQQQNQYQHQHFVPHVTSPNSFHDERISARFTSASMSGVTL